MQFGISIFPTIGPEDKSGRDHFRDALELARLADELGLHHVKTVEHYFFRYGGYSPDPVTFLAAAAARTRRIRLVTGAVIPAFTHPVKLAGQLAMLDNLCRGRLDVGFGRAFLPDEFAAFEISMDDSHSRFREGVEACRRLWSEQDVVWEGGHHRFGPVTLLPRPFQDPHPGILIATSITPESCAAAGRAGYGLMMVPSINKREKTQEMLALYRRARAEAGHDPETGEVHMSYNCYLAEDGAEARRKGRAYSEVTNRVMTDAVAAWGRTGSADYPGYERVLEKVRGSDFDRSLGENKVLVGSPDEVVEKVRVIREWFGDVTLSLQVISGNVPHEESARTVRLFAEHVMPRFTESVPAGTLSA
ncbi:alkanesulfonate monooxygenase SsuD/methylene tetrahydromethanopterin reductase-like flavin-dependent oxidoreductase (luciferase family) [Streptosporangium becharense]|uniref:Alkanesulfonate monooxygenase SsuD/methylene tetrahydromethanopterin reductase-like flavin-dependent oxidoreductase (Luciferase family) n=1 Tax=Streptosporangium becharense TaxID=1816182 RepID=A0A7W9MJF2_9ACTN|nr:LLM class flavin-dependent oxidoreductase [Streptosporangium becharense]MBB2910439.1 alkanesulfonate monooxygenase SsuD/methylene tetrahydromethanopterin reductase-like flavin-dependent oxidoreductase (luciferase family) [Streptosporangium becharense]MBB5823182.1 alkanesulfonate monooxygenase SsuD/methylene tetrahydromethanopterin reductase-like flavin-dependent oxidoreductase (luciferase family) [Streptosporangium becharense]